MAQKRMGLKELAARIAVHLARFAADPKANHLINPNDDPKAGCRMFYCTGAWKAGAYVGVCYVSYQYHPKLRRAEAEAYLKKLDEGFVGRHYEALREEKAPAV